jgi:hypothetical protein
MGTTKYTETMSDGQAQSMEGGRGFTTTISEEIGIAYGWKAMGGREF